ncbi:hypothetical protein OG792_09165 [Micromonospora sp. NBC_01699]|uniref:AAA family ATPase n=1 Tax=Micromonospora sp. NBC_01699 TaxID=2975984 RepID=UPI002E337149|nr:AAA family ATPase [Micromonospora sp. NBC_01699]
MPDPTPGVIVVTGVMAAGMSTVAHRLAVRLPRAAHVRGDVFRRMVVSNPGEPTPDRTTEATARLWLRYRLTTTVADTYAEAGFAPVVQDVVLGPELAEYVDLLATRPRHLVVLAPRPEVVHACESAGGGRGHGDRAVEMLDQALRRDTPRLGLWLDNSDQTPDETVEEILAKLSDARLPD